MITIQELKLLDVFRKNLLKPLTFNEIIGLSKKNSRAWVYNTLKEFVRRNFLEKIKVNNSYLYKANLNDVGLIKFFDPLDFADAHISTTKWSRETYDLLNEIRRSISNITPFFILLVFGSHANYTHTKKSDLDIAVIIDKENIKIKPYIEKIARKEIITIDYHIIAKEEFKEMLLRKEENLGKEIYRNHFIIWGGNAYYELIREAGENGFAG